jgi:Carboxypeptidase regulatory-like domain
MCGLRTSGPFILTALLTAMLSPHTHAQAPEIRSTPTPPIQMLAQILPQTSSHTAYSAAPPSDPEDLTAHKFPDAPDSHLVTQPPPDPPSGGSILGTVLDSNGAEIPNALVTLENTDSKFDRTLITDGSGFFKFDSVEPGRFNLTVTSTGFTPWVSTGFALQTGQFYDVPAVELNVASNLTEISVTATRHDIAEDQMHFAEKQRVFGIIPNFYASYIWNAAPLSAGQKFRLALRTTTDPVSIATPALVAGFEMPQNDFPGYGPGARGFARRFGASYADGLTSTMFAGAILPSILHQDPRYFYKGTGSITSRALYAMSTVVICKGDAGRWQPNYSNVLGNLASAGISNTYYPSSNRGAQLTIDNWLIGTASGAIGNLFQEFLVKKITHGVQAIPGL